MARRVRACVWLLFYSNKYGNTFIPQVKPYAHLLLPHIHAQEQSNLSACILGGMAMIIACFVAVLSGIKCSNATRSSISLFPAIIGGTLNINIISIFGNFMPVTNMEDLFQCISSVIMVNT